MAQTATKRKTATKKDEARVVISTPMAIRTLKMTIVGDSPLVMHRFSEKAQKEIAHRQDGTPKSKTKKARDPQAEYEASFYRDAKGNPCVPSVCFKNCIVTAAQRFYDVTKVMMFGALYIVGENMKLGYRKEEMHQGTVRLSGMNRTADLRYRPIFYDWYFDAKIQYDASVLEPAAICEFVNRAGFSVGLFEWRIDKGGEWGRFHISTPKEK